MKNARRHPRFCVKVYRHQVAEGRYFLHEHPMGAGSWKEPNMQAMVKKEKNILAKIDQCQYGLWNKDRTGSLLAKKPTKFRTNSPGIAKHLQKMCPGKHSHVEGAHASLFNCKTAQAQVYPKALCDAICEGLREQIELDKEGQFILAELRIEDATSGSQESQKIQCNLATGAYGHAVHNISTGSSKTAQASTMPTVTGDLEEELQQAWDDVVNLIRARYAKPGEKKRNTFTRRTCTQQCPGARPQTWGARSSL